MRKLRLRSCPACRRMVVVAVTDDRVAPYHDECTECGSELDASSLSEDSGVRSD